MGSSLHSWYSWNTQTAHNSANASLFECTNRASENWGSGWVERVQAARNHHGSSLGRCRKMPEDAGSTCLISLISLILFECFFCVCDSSRRAMLESRVIAKPHGQAVPTAMICNLHKCSICSRILSVCFIFSRQLSRLGWTKKTMTAIWSRCPFCLQPSSQHAKPASHLHGLWHRHRLVPGMNPRYRAFQKPEFQHASTRLSIAWKEDETNIMRSRCKK